MRETLDCFSSNASYSDYGVIEPTKELHCSNEKPISVSTRIVKDELGKIVSVKEYTSSGNLVKEGFYNSLGRIYKINEFNSDGSYDTKIYKRGVLTSKVYYDNLENIKYSVNYEYDNSKRLFEICEKNEDKVIKVRYKYDQIDRVVQRLIYKNDKNIMNQHYSYDILDRFVEYLDDNIDIKFKNISQTNKVLSYVIFDKSGATIDVVNYVSSYGYICTNVIINGVSFSIKDLNYLNNPIFEKPEATDKDFAYVTPSILKNKKLNMLAVEHLQREKALRNSNKVLPISMRKSNLFKIA